MKYYLTLQVKIFHRKLQAQGFPIIFFAMVMALAFIVAYHFLIKFSYASYALLFLALWAFESFQEKGRIEFLKTLFAEKTKLIQVRLIENSIILLPTVVLSAIAGIYWLIPILLSFYLLYSLQTNSFVPKSNKAIPTPFGKYPFEMIRFFRIYLPLILIALALLILGIAYDNPNLSLFAIAIIAFFVTTYLENVEPVNFLWNTIKSPKAFLIYKTKRIILQCYALITPLVITLLLFEYSERQVLICLAIYVLAFLFIILILLMKYSIFPRKIGILEGITLAISGLVPFLFIGLYPYYYKKSIANLKKYLC